MYFVMPILKFREAWASDLLSIGLFPPSCSVVALGKKDIGGTCLCGGWLWGHEALQKVN